jgi:hypothetical protein
MCPSRFLLASTTPHLSFSLIFQKSPQQKVWKGAQDAAEIEAAGCPFQYRNLGIFGIKIKVDKVRE